MAKQKQSVDGIPMVPVNGERAKDASARVDAYVNDRELVARCCDLLAAMGTLMVALVVASPEEGEELVDQIHQANFLAEALAKSARSK